MPEIKDFNKLLQQVEKKQYQPVYALHGEEAYYIDLICESIEKNALDEAEKDFNFSLLYGKDVEVSQIIDNARQFPTFAERRVVIVKEAQELKNIEQLEKYVSNPVESTVLVIAHKHKSFDKRKSWVKTLEKSDKIALFESKKLKDREVTGWILDYLQAKNYKIDPKALELIGGYLGNDLSKVSNELDKLMLNIPPSTTINAQHVQENIGISKDYNVFELQAALANKNLSKAIAIARHFCANPKENGLPAITAVLFNFFSKLYALSFLRGQSDKDMAAAVGVAPFMLGEYKMALQKFQRADIERVVLLLRDYDLRSKGVALAYTDDLLFSDTTGYEGLLTELVWQIAAG